MTRLAERLRNAWSLLLLLIIAAVWLHRTPYSASDLEVVPDAVEYAVGALQFLDSGRYELIIQGRSLPPRYPPWFSLSTLLPAYVLFGSEPGNAILSVTLFAVAGIGFAWAIGRQISSTAGGIVAALAVLSLPSYAMWSTQVMTDIPSTTLMLATCLLYLRLRRRPDSLLLYLAAGALVAFTTLLRPVFAAMLLPFVLAALKPWRAFFVRAAMLSLPIVAAAAGTFAYNAAVFGSPFRNGYKFWAAVPVDYPELMFSASNLELNTHVIVNTAFPILLLVCIAAAVFVRLRRRAELSAAGAPLRDVVTFVVLTCGPILLFHLFYFFPTDRFHISLLAGTAVIAGSLLGLLIPPNRTAMFQLLLPVILVAVMAARIAAPPPVPHRRLAAEGIREHTPADAIVISAIDPAYLERLAARGSARQIVPVSRTVEYASKLLVPRRIDDPQPRPVDWRDGRALGLMRAGAQDAVTFVASEQIDALVAAARGGKPVFLDATFLAGQSDAAAVHRLRERFSFTQRARNLYELQLL